MSILDAVLILYYPEEKGNFMSNNHYAGKNYSTNEGNTTVIGGTLEFTDEAKIKNFPGADNQSATTASSVSALAKDFNLLLVKLKEAGVMLPDNWNISVRLAPSLTDTIAASNNTKASISFEDNTISITVNVNELEESTSSVASQGTHKWIGLGIGTGLSSVTLAKYNGVQLTEDDANEAISVGLDQPGEFILYVKADELAEEAKTITLKADGYPEIAISIVVIQQPETN